MTKQEILNHIDSILKLNNQDLSMNNYYNYMDALQDALSLLNIIKGYLEEN